MLVIFEREHIGRHSLTPVLSVPPALVHFDGRGTDNLGVKARSDRCIMFDSVLTAFIVRGRKGEVNE